MSRAFTKENDDGQWLRDIAPTLSALLLFLTRENNDIRVYQERQSIDALGREVLHMSNGLAYTKDNDGRWIVAREDERNGG